MTVISIGLHLDCCCSVAQSCPTLCDSMDRSILGLRGPHHLPEFAQVHVHCISDAVQPSHPLTPSSPSQFSPSSETFPMITYLDQFSSVAQSCPIVCDPVDCSPPGLPVHHQLLELIQTHVHHIGDAIQPSHPLPSPSSHAFNLSRHQGLFKWVGSSHQVAKVLEFQLQYQSFQWIFRTECL